MTEPKPRPPSDPELCGRAVAKYRVATGTTWCMKLTGLPGHGTFSGTLVGTGASPTTVTLTVNTRDSLMWGPFLVLLIGLLACLLATPASKLLARLVRNNSRNPDVRIERVTRTRRLSVLA